MYEDVFRRSEDSNPRKIYGLINRRRIWDIGGQLTRAYARCKKITDRERNQRLAPVLVVLDLDANGEHDVAPNSRLGNINPPSVGRLCYSRRPSSSVIILWSHEGTLSGLGIRRSAASGIESKDIIGSTAQFAVCNEVDIPADDWLRGLVLTSYLEDYKRRVIGVKLLFVRGNVVQLGKAEGVLQLMHAENDLLLVGFKVQWSHKGQISALSLLQSPVRDRLSQTALLTQLQGTNRMHLSTI